jgi:hypothetical protein
MILNETFIAFERTLSAGSERFGKINVHNGSVMLSWICLANSLGSLCTIGNLTSLGQRIKFLSLLHLCKA